MHASTPKAYRSGQNYRQGGTRGAKRRGPTVSPAGRAKDLRQPLLVFVVLMLTLVRPVSVFAALPGRYLVRGQRRLVAWFGIRGVGSIYYMAYAAAHGIESLLAQTLFGIVVAAVGASILAHGISATPLMTWYEHRRARRRGVGPVDRAPP